MLFAVQKSSNDGAEKQPPTVSHLLEIDYLKAIISSLG